MKKVIEYLLFKIYPSALALRRRNTTLFRLLQPILISAEPEIALSLAIDFAAAAKTGGDYLEFGSYAGNTASLAYFFSRNAGLRNMRIFCFDSFEGLPTITGSDGEKGDFFKKGEYRCDRPTFEKNLKRRGVDMHAITVIEGWYENTLKKEANSKLGIRKAAVILIDCDLYASAIQALEFATDYVVDSTVVIFDDWFNFAGNPECGEQRAFKEWLARHPEITATEYHKVGWSVNSFILHKKASA